LRSPHPALCERFSQMSPISHETSLIGKDGSRRSEGPAPAGPMPRETGRGISRSTRPGRGARLGLARCLEPGAVAPLARLATGRPGRPSDAFPSGTLRRCWERIVHAGGQPPAPEDLGSCQTYGSRASRAQCPAETVARGLSFPLPRSAGVAGAHLRVYGRLPPLAKRPPVTRSADGVGGSAPARPPAGIARRIPRAKLPRRGGTCASEAGRAGSCPTSDLSLRGRRCEWTGLRPSAASHHATTTDAQASPLHSPVQDDADPGTPASGLARSAGSEPPPSLRSGSRGTGQRSAWPLVPGGMVSARAPNYLRMRVSACLRSSRAWPPCHLLPGASGVRPSPLRRREYELCHPSSRVFLVAHTACRNAPLHLFGQNIFVPVGWEDLIHAVGCSRAK